MQKKVILLHTSVFNKLFIFTPIKLNINNKYKTIYVIM